MKDDPIGEAAEAGKRRVVGAKLTSSGKAGRGTVESIREAKEGGVTVTIRHGEKPKPKDGCCPDWPESSSVFMSAADARGINVGDKGRVVFVKE